MSNEIQYIEEEYSESVKTYFWGKFNGKYRGAIDESTIDLHYEKLYEFEIYEGVVTTHKEFFQKHDSELSLKKIKEIQKEPIYKAPFPDTVRVILKESNKQFDIQINEPRLKNIRLKNHVIENDLVFGEIEAEITGYIVHQVKKTRLIEILPPEPEPPIHEPPRTVPPRPEPPEPEPPRTVPPRPEPPEPEPQGCWETFKELLLWIIVLAIAIPLIIHGWQVLLFLLGLGLILYLLSIIPTKVYGVIGNTLFYIFLIFLIGVILFSIIDAINNKGDTRYVPKPKKDTVVKQDTIMLPPIDSVDTELDTFIVNRIFWEDYMLNEYQGEFINSLKDLMSSNFHRNSLNNNMQGIEDYNKMLKSLFFEDNPKLVKIYSMFDSIRVEKNLNKFEFAEMVVSCIQHIPYVLLLHNDCNKEYNKDSFVKSYLDSGGECIGNVRYGIYSPVEFSSTLSGDCDTRTLITFSILNHFGYDVAILGSELYKHSILAVNLPYNGIYKDINGKRYYVWETTSTGFSPGVIDLSIANMNFWNVNLKN
jgi:hypothetical protein